METGETIVCTERTYDESYATSSNSEYASAHTGRSCGDGYATSSNTEYLTAFERAETEDTDDSSVLAEVGTTATIEHTDPVYTESYIKTEGKLKGVIKDDGLRTIPDCIRYYAETLKDKEAMVFADYNGGRTAVTWQEVYEKSKNTAKSLVKLGVKPGELVAINIRPCPEWLYLAFGAMFAGAAPVCISFTYKDENDLLKLMNKMVNCTILVLDPGADDEIWSIVEHMVDSFSPDGTATCLNIPSLRYVIGHEVGETTVMNGVKHLQELITDDNSSIDLPEIHEDDVAVVAQTSGSAGLPKLVVHTHKSVVYTRHITAGSLLDELFILYNDRPFRWFAGFPFNFIIGQKRVTMSGFSPEPADRVARVVEVIHRERCTFLSALPPMIHKLVAYQATQGELPADWPVIAVFTGGKPLTKGLASAIGMLAPALATSYAALEFLIFSSSIVHTKQEFTDFYVGKIDPLPGLEAKVVDEDGNTVPVNTKGEIFVRTPTLFKEYIDDPEKTSAAVTPDGWFKTDDIGMMTEHGDFYVYGRKSEMIKFGGVNVITDIIEQEMKKCTGVKAVKLVQVSDEAHGIEICACVIRSDGSDITEEEVRRYCEEKHNANPIFFTIVPNHCLFLESFPQTPCGKTSVLKLSEIAQKRFKASHANDSSLNTTHCTRL